MDDIYCKIIRGELPSTKIYEDDNVIAILDINYVNKGHALVIHKECYRNILSIPEDKWIEMAKVIHKIAPAVKKGSKADGLNIIMNTEPAGHQQIFHIHAHIIPRHEDDGIEPWPQQSYKEGEKEKYGEMIRSEI